MMILEHPVHNGYEPAEALRKQIRDRLLGRDSNIIPTNLDWLIRQAMQCDATVIYFDWQNGHYNFSLRIAGRLNCVCSISLKDGRKYVRDIKKKLHLDSFELQTVWSGWFPDKKRAGQRYKIYLIPFRPLESIIIRLRPLEPACPSWTDSPNIHKKIFIWQMGKVGSSTILSSLKPYTKEYNWPYCNESNEISDEPYWRYNNIIHSHSAKPIYHTLHHSDEEFIVVSLVRDLLQRNISAVFQSMTDETPGNDCFIAPEEELRKWDYKHIQREVRDRLYKLNLSDTMTSWYDALLKSHYYYPDVDRYHVDIYATPFDRQNGMQIYESKIPRVKFIIIRLENLSELASRIGDFFGIIGFRLRQDNISSCKWYKDIYRRFKESYTPSVEEYNHIYNSRFMKYFYGVECGR